MRRTARAGTLGAPQWGAGLLVGLLGATSFGCGAGTAQGAIVVEAPGPGAEHYATEATPHAVRGAVAGEALRTAVQRAAREEGATLRGDGRLGTLAQWVLERTGPEGHVSPHVVAFFARHLGLVEPPPHVLMVAAENEAGVAEAIYGSLREAVGQQRYTHYGAAAVRRQGGVVAMVVLSWRWLELTSLPRQTAAQGSLDVMGALDAELSNPKVLAQTPEGSVRRFPAGSGPRFHVRVPVQGSGTHRVEILAEGAEGPTVVANFPIYAGRAPPDSVTLETPAEPATPERTDDVRARLYELINEARQREGLKPLVRHKDLAEVAKAHSRDMRDRHFVGHTSPSTGSAANRVAAAGLYTGLVLENIGRGYSASEIHQGLMQSPGHRANILHPAVTHLGVGVVAEKEGNRSAFLATQLFTRMGEPIEPERAAERLLEMLNEARRVRGAEPLEPDPNLRKAAQQGAQQFFEEPSLSEREVIEQASSAMKRFSIAFSRVGGVMAVVQSVDEAARLEPALDPSVRSVGIGVAQGQRPDTGPQAIAVVIMLGWPR